MCSSCWRCCCCCSKVDHEDPPAREVRPRQSNRNVRATTRSHNVSRRSNTGGINSGEEKLPVSSLPPVRPVQAAQAVSIPPIVNWMTAGRSRARQGSTSGTTSGRRSAPRGIMEGRGSESRRRSPSLEDVTSISSSAEDTSSVGETSSLSGRSPEREIVSRAGQTPPPPPSVMLGGDSPGGELPLDISLSQESLLESTLGPTEQLPLEASRSGEAVSGVSHLDFSGEEQYANDLPNQPDIESQEIASSELGDSPLPSTASGQLLVQGGTPANDIGSTDLSLGEREDAIQSRDVHDNEENDIPHRRQVVEQGNLSSLSRTPPKEVGSARSSITNDRTKQKHRGTFSLSRTPVSSSDQKGLSEDHASHAGPSSWEASDEERLDSGRHRSRKGGKKRASQPPGRRPKALYQGEAEISQMVASTVSTAESTTLPKPEFSARRKDRSSYQPIPRGMASRNVPGEKRTVFSSRKTSSQGRPAAQRDVPGTTASEKDPTTHQSTTKFLKTQGGMYSGNGQPGKLTQMEPAATANDSRQALATSRHPISEAGSSNPGRVSRGPGSDFKPGVNANDENIPTELSAQGHPTVLSSTSEFHAQKSVHDAVVAPRPKARVVRSRAAQPPASTVRRRMISLPRPNPIQTAAPVRQREYYLLDENPDNWLSPSMELYEIADVVYGYLTEYISFMGLGGFYPRGSSYLHELSANAAAMIKRVTKHTIEGVAENFIDNLLEGVAESLTEEYGAGDAGDAGDAGGGATGDSTVLNTPNDIIDMIKVALYDVIIYCDDSGSMNAEGGGRIEALKELVRRVTKITSTFDTAGIKVRFINFADDDGFNNLHTVDEAQQMLDMINFSGGTRIGTGLEQKILDPLLFDKLRAGTLKRPLLVTTITDGSPYGEDESHFKNMIVKCKETLKEEGFQSTSVMFQVSQVGSAADGEHFIHILHNDSQVGEMVYCTAEKLDDKIAELKDNEGDLERWLLDLLLQGL